QQTPRAPAELDAIPQRSEVSQTGQRRLNRRRIGTEFQIQDASGSRPAGCDRYPYFLRGRCQHDHVIQVHEWLSPGRTALVLELRSCRLRRQWPRSGDLAGVGRECVLYSNRQIGKLRQLTTLGGLANL